LVEGPGIVYLGAQTANRFRGNVSSARAFSLLRHAGRHDRHAVIAGDFRGRDQQLRGGG
jgi:hypothetical protein